MTTPDVGRAERPAFFRARAFNQTMCCICLEKYTDDNPPVEYSCEHAFHLQCAEAWFMRSPRCPVCESDIRGGECRVLEKSSLPIRSDSSVSISRSPTETQTLPSVFPEARDLRRELRRTDQNTADDEERDRLLKTTDAHHIPSAVPFDSRVPMEVDGVLAQAGASPSTDETPVVRRSIIRAKLNAVGRALSKCNFCCCGCFVKRRPTG